MPRRRVCGGDIQFLQVEGAGQGDGGPQERVRSDPGEPGLIPGEQGTGGGRGVEQCLADLPVPLIHRPGTGGAIEAPHLIQQLRYRAEVRQPGGRNGYGGQGRSFALRQMRAHRTFPHGGKLASGGL